MGFVFTSLFVIGHDCAHESFTGNKRLNSLLGHILFVPAFYPYYACKYSHAETIYYANDNIFAIFKFWLIPALFFQFWMSLYTFLHHTSEDMSFYPQKEWNQYRGQIKSTTNYKMPVFISALHFHIDRHIPHHPNIKIKSYMLLAAQLDLNQSKYFEDMQEEKFTWKHYFKTIRNFNLSDEANGGYVQSSNVSTNSLK